MEIGFNRSVLNLTWEIKSFKNDTMMINLNYSSPLDISPSIDRDILYIKFDQSANLINCISRNKRLL